MYLETKTLGQERNSSANVFQILNSDNYSSLHDFVIYFQ